MIFKVSFKVSVLAYLEEPEGLDDHVAWIVEGYKGILTHLYDVPDIYSEYYTTRSRDIDYPQEIVYGYNIYFYIQNKNIEGFYHIRNILESFHGLVVYLMSDFEISPLEFDPKPLSLPISPEGE